MNLFKSISIYAASNISRQAVGFLLLPIITTYLSTGQNGDLDTIVSIVSVLTYVILLSSHGAINLEFFRKDLGQENYASFVTSALVNPVILAIALTIVLLFFAPELAAWLDIKQQWLLFIPLLCIINLIPSFTSTLFQAQKKPFHHSIYNIALTLLDLSLAVLLIVGFSLNWEGRLWATLASKVTFTFIGIYLLWRGGFIKMSVKKEYVKEALWFGLPLMPHVIGGSIMDLSDRIFIREMVSKEELGIYGIGYKVGSIILIIQAALLMAWNPFFFEKMKNINPRNKTYIVTASYGLMILLLICCLLLTVLAPVVYLFIGNDFASGIKYVFWVSLAYVFLGFYKMFSGFIFYEKKNMLLSYIAIFNIVTNLTLNYFLIKEYGAMGAAYATTLSYFLFFLLTAFISQRVYPMPWFNFRDIYYFIKGKYFA